MRKRGGDPVTARLPERALDAVLLRTPCLVEGEVMHRRARPAVHAFTYRAFCLRLPLSRLRDLETAGVRVDRAGLASFHSRDHGARDGSALEAWARALLAREGISCNGEIVLHAFPRMLGYVFDPVSFWTCHDADGHVRAVLAEVNNTFGERHLYLLAHDDGHAIANGETLRARKSLHVSPFCNVTGHYAFRFHFGPERFLARVDYYDSESEADGPLLATSISGVARPLPRRSGWTLLWRYRWFTLGVIARIHWQAARLWLARVPFVRKPAPPSTTVTRGR